MVLNDKWIKKALKRKGIKGEHAYLEAIKDVIAEIDKEIESIKYKINALKLYKVAGKIIINLEKEAKILEDFKLNLFNTNKKK